MKYLLGFLEGLPDGPNLSDPEFQQLLVDVQAGKTQPKSADAFYESLEKVVNELKSTPESQPFQKPVTRRDAPDYYEVIKKPMDLSTMLRNIKQHKYKAKADFAADLNLIWDNCAMYNHEGHPIRVQARFMKQKAEHHLEFLADRNDPPPQAFILPNLAGADSVASRRIAATGSHAPSQPSPLREASQVPGQADEDAQGESLGSDEGADGGGDQSFRDEAGAGPQSKTAAEEDQEGRETPSGSSNREAGSSTEAKQNQRFQAGGVSRGSTANWPKLQTSLDSSPALVRTSSSMNHFSALSLAQSAGSSFSDKGKSREIVTSSTAPQWYPSGEADAGDEISLDGKWWGSLVKDEAYTSGVPSIPSMAPPAPRRILRIKKKTRRKSPRLNGDALGLDAHSVPSQTPSLSPPRAVKLERLVHRNVDKLFEARRLMGQIQDWQRVEGEGAALPPIQRFNRKLEQEQSRFERAQRREHEQEFWAEGKAKAKVGGEMGEAEAVAGIRKATAGMLAHAGFEGANEIALNTLTRLVTDHMRNIGRTFRLFLDGSSQDMSPEQMTLHALHQNGQVQVQDLEAHIKDDIEREGTKIAELTRRVRQGYKDVTAAPVVQDDMLFAADGEMLMDGNFADELGEDFLGLREMGIDKEFGLSSLTVPSNLFHGRRKRAINADQYGPKQPEYDYPPPPPFIPLNHSSMFSQLPALLHGFYSSRLESGESISEDDSFDHLHSQIASMGQIIEKKSGVRKKVTDGEKRERPDDLKKIKPKKPPKLGVGKGNWIRPPKEERDRRAAEKKAALQQSKPGTANGAGEDGVAGDDDAEGEEE